LKVFSGLVASTGTNRIFVGGSNERLWGSSAVVWKSARSLSDGLPPCLVAASRVVFVEAKCEQVLGLDVQLEAVGKGRLH